jgi:prepilin-type processing-associated H-X9-DG protein
MDQTSPPSESPIQLARRPLDYATPSLHKRRIWPLVTVLSIAGFLIIFLGLSLSTPSLHSRDTAPRVKCGSNLRQIGQAMLLYANEHGGQYPDSFETVLSSEEISADVFCCPSTSVRPASGATTQATIANFGAGHHCSYCYVARGAIVKSSPDIVLAYEPLSNHDDDGMNVLFNDGHVEFIAKPGAEALLKRMATTTQPVLWVAN